MASGVEESMPLEEIYKAASFVAFHGILSFDLFKRAAESGDIDECFRVATKERAFMTEKYVWFTSTLKKKLLSQYDDGVIEEWCSKSNQLALKERAHQGEFCNQSDGSSEDRHLQEGNESETPGEHGEGEEEQGSDALDSGSDSEEESEQPTPSKPAATPKRKRKNNLRQRRGITKRQRVAEREIALAEESNDRLAYVERQLSQHSIVVEKLSLVDILVRQAEVAFDPLNPNLHLLPEIIRGALKILQGNFYHRKKSVTKLADSTPPAYDSSSKIATFGCHFEKSANVKNVLIDQELQDAFNLFHKKHSRATRSSSRKTPSVLDMIKIGKKTMNLLMNLINLGLYALFASQLTMEQLFHACGNTETLLRRAGDLWNDMDLTDPWNPKVTMLDYMNSVLVRALSMEEHREQARSIAKDMYENSTDTKNDIIPAYKWADNNTIGGNTNAGESSGEKYFSGNKGTHAKRRYRASTITFNILDRLETQERASGDVFPLGFIHSMLMTAPSYIVDNCNFFKNGVERIDDSVLEKLKGCGHTEDDEKAVVFDSQGQVEAVRALLPREPQRAITC